MPLRQTAHARSGKTRGEQNEEQAWNTRLVEESSLKKKNGIIPRLMKPFPACYRAARYRAANCRRGFPSFLNGERRVAKRKAKGFSHERTNSRFIHSRWTVSWKDNRARTRASSFADREPLIASSRSPKLLFARLFFPSLFPTRDSKD